MTVREHTAMRECRHTEADLLFPRVCSCGWLNLPDPSWIIVGAGFALLGLNVWSWWAM